MPSTNGHGPKRAILYSRVSTDEQARTGYSLAQQLEALREYAAREGYEVLEEVSDPGQSGASLDRPGMDRVRDLVAARGADVVLAQDRDRFAREPAYLYILKEEFAERSTTLLALNQRGDDSPEGELTDGILDQFAKYEREKLKERTRRGKLQKAREGKVIPQRVPTYGFRYNASRDGYEVDEPRMAVVRRIFEMVAVESRGLQRVKKILDAEGIPTPGGARFWAARFVRDAIREDAYKPHSYEEVKELVAPEVANKLDPTKRYGIWWFNRLRKTRRVVALTGPGGRREYRKRAPEVPRPREEWIAVPVPDSGIPREWVDAARATIEGNQRPASRRHRYFELVGGIIRCGGCGRAMWTNSIVTRGQHYYRCPTRHRDGAGACAGTGRNAARIEAEVWSAVRSVLLDPERLRADLDAMIEMKRRALRAGSTDEIDRWLKVLAAADGKRAKYQRAYAADVMTLADLKARLAELDEERQIAETELARLRSSEAEIKALEEQRDALLESYVAGAEEALDARTPEERHTLYKNFGVEVTAHPDGATEIILGELLGSGEVVAATPTPRCRATTARDVRR
jgi:site-specific DNA recombinase